jgi:hypothetical protein
MWNKVKSFFGHEISLKFRRIIRVKQSHACSEIPSVSTSEKFFKTFSLFFDKFSFFIAIQK